MMSIEVASALLGIGINSSKDEILSAFKARARLVHPDLFEVESKAKVTAEESMKQLNIAKEIMLNYVANPSNFQPKDNIKNRSSNETFDKAKNSSSKNNSKTSDSKSESEEKPFASLEEEIEYLRGLRKADIIEAKSIFKSALIVYLINLCILLILVIITGFSIFVWIKDWNFLMMFLVALLFIGSVWFWRRTLQRFYVVMHCLGEWLDHKRVGRAEEKSYRKALKPENPNSFLYKVKTFKDKF